MGFGQPETTIDNAAALTAKVAALSVDEALNRMQEIADTQDHSPEAMLEFVKCLLGPGATLTE